MSESFVYCWTDHLTGKLYIGSHKGTDDDGYICSSKYMLEEYRTRPHDFTRQIVAHGTDSDIRKLERTLLVSLNAKNNPSFYNRHNASGDRPNLKGIPKTEATKRKMRKPKSESHKKKFIGNTNAKGHIKTPEVIEKVRLQNLGRKRTPEAVTNLRTALIRSYQNGNRDQSKAGKKGWETRRKNMNVPA